MKVLAQPAVLVILGMARCPMCLPGAPRSMVQETGDGLMLAPSRCALGSAARQKSRPQKSVYLWACLLKTDC